MKVSNVRVCAPVVVLITSAASVVAQQLQPAEIRDIASKAYTFAYDAPTNVVWPIGRTQTNNASDYDNVHAIQKGYLLLPLGAASGCALGRTSPKLKICNQANQST